MTEPSERTLNLARRVLAKAGLRPETYQLAQALVDAAEQQDRDQRGVVPCPECGAEAEDVIEQGALLRRCACGSEVITGVCCFVPDEIANSSEPPLTQHLTGYWDPEHGWQR